MTCMDVDYQGNKNGFDEAIRSKEVKEAGND